MGAPHAHRARAEGTREGHPGVLRRPVHGRERLGVLRRRHTTCTSFIPGRSRLHRAGDRAGAVGRERAAHRQQRVRRDHPHAEPRLRRARAPQARRSLSRKTKKGNRLAQRTHLPHGQQRGLPRGVRHRAGQVRGSGERALPHARLAGEAPASDESGSAAAISPRPTCGSLPRSCASTRSTTRTSSATCGAWSTTRTSGATRAALRAAARGEDRGPGPDQGALLPQHEADQPDANRAQRAVAGLFGCTSGCFFVRQPWPPATRWTACSRPAKPAWASRGRSRLPPRTAATTATTTSCRSSGTTAATSTCSPTASVSSSRPSACATRRFCAGGWKASPATTCRTAWSAWTSAPSGDDLGVGLRLRLGAGFLYGEAMHNVSDESDGTELRLGYRYERWWTGRLRWRPYVTLAWRDADLNNYYYGVRPRRRRPSGPRTNRASTSSSACSPPTAWPSAGRCWRARGSRAGRAA